MACGFCILWAFFLTVFLENATLYLVISVNRSEGAHLEDELRIFFLVVFIIQLLLCFKAKKRFIRLLPVLLLLAGACLFLIGCVYCSRDAADEWLGAGHAILAMFCVQALVICGIAWIVLAIFGKKKDSPTSTTE